MGHCLQLAEECTVLVPSSRKQANTSTSDSFVWKKFPFFVLFLLLSTQIILFRLSDDVSWVRVIHFLTVWKTFLRQIDFTYRIDWEYEFKVKKMRLRCDINEVHWVLFISCIVKKVSCLPDAIICHKNVLIHRRLCRSVLHCMMLHCPARWTVLCNVW